MIEFLTAINADKISENNVCLESKYINVTSGATNGLNVNSIGQIALGGVLTGDTVIGATGSTNNFSILGLHTCMCMVHEVLKTEEKRN